MSLPLHLFASSIILSIYLGNLEYLNVSDLVFWLLAINLTVLAFDFLLVRAVGNRKKALIISTVFFVPFLLHGYIVDFIEILASSGPWRFERYRIHQVVFWTLAAFISGSTYLTVRTAKAMDSLSMVVRFTTAVLIAITLLNALWGAWEERWFDNQIDALMENDSFAAPAADSRYPDIYYIILDTYGRSDTLRRAYGFDNSEFLGFLRDKGFYISEKSRSNYVPTFLSLSSSLNMTYLDFISSEAWQRARDRKMLHRMLQNHRVQRFLKSRGYTFINIGGDWVPTSYNKYADINLRASERDGKGLFFYRKMLFYPVLVYFGSGSRNRKQELIDFQFDVLAQAKSLVNGGPSFIFAHVLLPHGPHVFDRDCGRLTREDALARGEKENYIESLSCANKKVYALVEKILVSAKRPPVIIIQSDEGPKKTEPKDIGDYTWNDFMERTGILNAIYLPGKGREALYADISPVNTFRLIFNLYLGADFKLLPDRSYVGGGLEHPFKLYDADF